jgi:hypothetical protein
MGQFQFCGYLLFRGSESKKSVIFAISWHRDQSALAKKGQPHLNLPAPDVFTKESF